MSSLFPHPVAASLNHVLRATPVAMERLRRHAGRTVAFHVGPVTSALTVQTTGEVTSALPGATRDLDVRISPFLVPRLAARDEAAYGEIEMTGDPELAGEIAFLMRNLRWDAEEDLARWIGDAPAHRIGETARALAGWGQDAAQRVAQGAAEYWTEEDSMIASRVKVETFTREVAELAEAIERLEKRIEGLDKH